MGTTEQTALPYRLTEDTIVLVPLIIVGLYVTLSLIRTIFDYAKSGTKQKGAENNTSTGAAQTQNKLFRPITGADKHAKAIQGPIPLSARRKNVSFGTNTELENTIDGDSTNDQPLYARAVSAVSGRGENTDVPQASINRENGERGQVRGCYYCGNDICQDSRQINTDCTYDPQTVKHIVVGITKTLVQETQKQMFSAFEQLLQQTYASLSLDTPVKAEEQCTKCINNENIVILTSNTGNPPPPTDDWNEEDDAWNLDGVQPALPSSSIQPAATSSDDTTPKVVASAASTGNISGAAAAHSNPRRSSLSSRPSAYISAIPAGYESDDDYLNYYRPDNPRLIATSTSFAASINFRGRPNNRQVRGHRPYQQPQTFSRPPPWHNRPYGRKTRSQEALRARAYRKVARRYPIP